MDSGSLNEFLPRIERILESREIRYIYIYIYYIEGSSVHESVATIDERRGEGKDKVDESIKPMNILFSIRQDREFVRVCVETPRRIHVHTLYISSLD